MDGIIESTVNAEPVVNVEPQTNEVVTEQVVSTESAIGEVATPQQNEKPIQSAEENAKFAEVRRRATEEARTAARDEMIAEMYGQSHGIKTYAEYQEAIANQEQEQKLADLLEQNIPEEYATEMLENRKFREQFEAEQTAKQQQAQQQEDMKDFISAFPEVKPNDIPAEVWKANANGIPLRYAYAEHALKLTQAAQTKAKANEENARGSMGNVGSNGTANDGYFTKDQVSKMTTTEVAKNYEKICESTKKW